MLRFRLELAQSELDSVIPHTVITTTDIRDMDIIRVAITATTAVIHIPEPITTLGGRTTTTTTAIELTSITSVITTATKADGLVRALKSCLGAIPSQLSRTLNRAFVSCPLPSGRATNVAVIRSTVRRASLAQWQLSRRCSFSAEVNKGQAGDRKS